MREASKACEDHQKARDLEGYMKRKREEKLAWTKKNPERVSEIGKGVRSRALEPGKHRCEIYNRPFQSVTALAKHEKSATHQEMKRLAEGGQLQEVSAEAQREKNFAAGNKESGKHHCSLCDLTSGLLGHWKSHMGTAKHWGLIDKLEKTDPEAAASWRIKSQPYVKFFCTFCNKPFASSDRFAEHEGSTTHKRRKVASEETEPDTAASPFAFSKASAAPPAPPASPFASAKASAAPCASAALASLSRPSKVSTAASTSKASTAARKPLAASPGISKA